MKLIKYLFITAATIVVSLSNIYYKDPNKYFIKSYTNIQIITGYKGTKKLIISDVNDSLYDLFNTPLIKFGRKRTRHAVLLALNNVRASQGLNPVSLNATLSRAAQKYALIMRAGDFTAHVPPGLPRQGNTLFDRVAAAGGKFKLGQLMEINVSSTMTYSDGREYPSTMTAKSAMKLYWSSKSHRKIMLHPEAYQIGVGYSNGYLCIILLKP